MGGVGGSLSEPPRIELLTSQSIAGGVLFVFPYNTLSKLLVGLCSTRVQNIIFRLMCHVSAQGVDERMIKVHYY